jgi:hypothetical protein
MSNNPTLHFEYGNDDRFLIKYENGDTEQLKLTDVGPGLYRLEESSLVGDAVYGDTIRVHSTPSSDLMFLEIADRSTLTTQSWILSAEVLGADPMKKVLAAVMDAGGMWEQALGGLLMVHTPPDIAQTVSEEITAASSTNTPAFPKV